MRNSILVTRFHSLNRDFTLNRDSLNRDFTVVTRRPDRAGSKRYAAQRRPDNFL